MTESVGFRMTADVAAIICFVFAVTYFALAGGPTAFSSTCRKETQPEVVVPDDGSGRKALPKEIV